MEHGGSGDHNDNFITFLVALVPVISGWIHYCLNRRWRRQEKREKEEHKRLAATHHRRTRAAAHGVNGGETAEKAHD